MKMNIELLGKVRRIILKRHQQINMGTFFQNNDTRAYCGTTACIAGWAYTLDKLKKPNPKVAHELLTCDPHIAGMKSLGLTNKQACKLFYTEDWPEKFKMELFQFRSGTKKYAMVVAARISHFIKTKGAK